LSTKKKVRKSFFSDNCKSNESKTHGLHLLIFRAVDQRDTFFNTKTYSTLAAKNNRGGKHMLLLNIIKNHLINRDKRIIKNNIKK
jgi:hypothetical protein